MKHNILLIDDSSSFRKMMTSFLSEEGFVVKAVSSSEEGIALLHQKIMPLSLIIVDYRMPSMKGPEIIRRLKDLFTRLEGLYEMHLLSRSMVDFGLIV